MKKSTFNALLVGGGFLLGTVGVKAVTSAPAKKAYVQGIACGLRAKNCYQDMVEQAKAEVDDMVAGRPTSPASPRPKLPPRPRPPRNSSCEHSL